MDTKLSEQSNSSPPQSIWGKLAIVAAVALAAAFLYRQFGSYLSLESMAQQEAVLRNYQAQHPVLIFTIAFLIYVLVTGLSLPGAVPLSLTYGWFFGFLEAFVLVSFASTLGATIAFLFSRYLFRDAIMNRFGEHLAKYNQALEREGPFYLFTLRLIPAAPFFVVNAVMGLTPIKTTTFWWVSQIGMLAGTAVFIYAGSSVPDLATLADKSVNAAFTPLQMTRILGALVLLGIFPLIARWGIRSLTKKKTPPQ